MIRYFVATLAALYTVLMIFGDESRRPEPVTRAATDDASGFSLADFALPRAEPATPAIAASGPSESDAVVIAIEAGAKLRRERGAQSLQGTEVAALAETVSQRGDTGPEGAALRYITGSRVNLRSGPGTGNEVVGQLTHGTAAEVLGGEGGWVHIRSAEGGLTGWVAAKFLDERKPG